ncbi:MAG: hypothetical protein AB8B66_01485 [Rickettsiaceae bacterium]
MVDEKVKDKEWEDAIDNYADAVKEIIKQDCIESLPILLKYFDDNNHTDFVLEHLLSSIGEYGYHNNNNDAYVKALLQHIHIMIPRAIGYAHYLLHDILSDTKSYKILKNNLR